MGFFYFLLQNTEEDSYYYEYPYYEDPDGKPYQSPDADATTKEEPTVI